MYLIFLDILIVSVVYLYNEYYLGLYLLFFYCVYSTDYWCYPHPIFARGFHLCFAKNN